ncbi:MAG: hypothetical protein FJ100_20105 [Deltaproteobacteria bacterium]|nr:hypothetical protein [Deltaproteobacteria bacterium]
MTVVARAFGLAACAAVWSTLAVGCVDSDEVASRCSSDADCGPGLRCYQSRICIASAPPNETVAIRLTPPKASGKLVEHFELDLNAHTRNEPVALMLSEPAVVRLTYSAAFNLTPVQGKLVATAQTDVKGNLLRYEATRYFGKDGKAFSGYELSVQPGKTYDLVFDPAADVDGPPHYSKITVSASFDHGAITLPQGDGLVEIRGKLVAGKKPLVGLRTQLVNAAGQTISTSALTDKTGAFAIHVGPSAVAGHLTFAPTESSLALPQGRLEEAVDVAGRFKAEAKPKPLLLGELDTGKLPAAVTATVEVKSDIGESEVGALVRVQTHGEAKGKSVQAYVEVQGYTDHQGRVVLHVPAGPALLSVLPASGSRAARWSGKVEMTAGWTNIGCTRRSLVKGVVTDYAGRKLHTAKVWLRRVAQPGENASELAGSAQLGEVPLETVTNAQGAFELPVDAGGWWLWVHPRPADLLPRWLAAKVEVTPGSDTAVQISVPAPILVIGKVVTAAGSPVANAAVEILARSAAPQPAVTRGPQGKGARSASPAVTVDSLLLGSALSDGAGLFEVLLAPPQP